MSMSNINSTGQQAESAGLFSANGCKLHYNGNQVKEYSYDAEDMQKTGNTGYFEQTLNKHLKDCYGQGDLAFGELQLNDFVTQLNEQLNKGSVLVLTENRPQTDVVSVS